MSIPTKSQIERPLLQLLANGAEWKRKDIVDKLASHFNLTDAELDDEFPKGGKRFDHYCSRAIEDLKADDLIESPRRGYWEITEKGKETT